MLRLNLGERFFQMASYLLFANPKGKPIMTVSNLKTALELSWHCAYYILPKSDYRQGEDIAPELAPMPSPETQAICCTNCGIPQGDSPMTLNLGLAGNTWLCEACMVELEQEPQLDFDED